MENVKRASVQAFAFGAISMALYIVYGWVQNSVLFPRFADYFPIGREIDTFLRAVICVAIAFVFGRKPAVFNASACSLASIVLMIPATALLYAACALQSAALTVIGLICFEIGHTWSYLVLGVALCRLGSPRVTALAVAFGIMAGDIIRHFVGILPLAEGMAAFAILPIVTIILCGKAAKSFLDGFSSGTAPSDLEIANPKAFLKPTSALFICILFFSIASGFGLTLNEINNAPNISNLEWMPVAIVALMVAVHRKPGGEDSLFSFSVLIVIAGFLLAPFTFGDGTGSANALLRGGRSCFDILVWTVVAAIGMRNPSALVAAICVSNAMRSIGTIIGAMAGHLVNAIAPMNSLTASAITAYALFFFLAFLWVGFRSFSFEATVRNLESPAAPSCSTPPEEESFADRCATIGTSFGLSEREIEVFEMLARGRNVNFIQEHFVISRNTVKTHVKRIYKKLGVHSQQELIDLVEQNETAPKPQSSETM